MISIEVNGQSRELASGSSVTDLLTGMALTGQRVAVECNMEIIPRSQHASTTLKAGDQLEIVHAIGGG